MFKLKPISKDSIPMALEKAKFYRLMNDPWQTESICRDILQVQPNNQEALLNLILSITDQFGAHQTSSINEAEELCAQLTDKYQQKYYNGLIHERLGKAALKRSTPRARFIAYEYYHTAMDFYKEAEKIRPKDNEESVLRWNASVRKIIEFNLEPAPTEERIQPFLDI